ERSLIQTIGRAARHIHGTAILYADVMTDSMRRALEETDRRRRKQLAYNAAHKIVPRSVHKRIKDLIDGVYDQEAAREGRKAAQAEAHYEAMSEAQLAKEIRRVERDMLEAAKNLEFEKAAELRDRLKGMKSRLFLGYEEPAPPTLRVVKGGKR
ncbi:MAG TPA: UvrB/UvrC motif-containing protein, partial [Burkholderiales bacterium]|nr:UvrB/UvrC motif-containing protein [Burkholderiales bacterium]